MLIFLFVSSYYFCALKKVIKYPVSIIWSRSCFRVKLHRHHRQCVVDDPFIRMVVSIIEPFLEPFWYFTYRKTMILCCQITLFRSSQNYWLVLATMPEFQFISSPAKG